MFREPRNIFDAAQTKNFGKGHAASLRRTFETIAKVLIILVLCFRLDKQSDAKRFFVPLSRKFCGMRSSINWNDIGDGVEDPMKMTRREVCSLLPAGMLPVFVPIAEAGEQGDALPSGGHAFETLTVHTTPSGAQTREALKGKLATGEALETHATTLPPGAMPHPPHHHVHSEMFLMREGTLELTVSGKTYQLGPGAIGFVRSNEEHGVKNVGTTAANYFVVEIGPGAAGA